MLTSSDKINEYRKLLGDHSSPEESITKRLEYLEAFCRNVIKIELQNYVQSKKTI